MAGVKRGTVQTAVLDCGGLFKGYELQKIQVLSANILETDVLSLNYWLPKFIMEKYIRPKVDMALYALSSVIEENWIRSC